MMSLPFGSFAETSARKAPVRWAALIFILLSLEPATLAQKSEEHDKDDPRARAEYLEQKRGGKAGTPPGARLRALKEVDGMLEREGKAYWDSVSKASTSPMVESSGAVREASTAGPAPTPGGSQWIAIGPQATNPRPDISGETISSGRVTALAVDPHDSSGNTVYLGAAQGGIWKTTDGGSNWIALTDQQPSLATGSIALDSTTTPFTTIYVGTGEENFGSDSYYGAGVLKSSDGGSTWIQLGAGTFAPMTQECTASRLSCGGAQIGALSIQPGTGGNTAVLLAAVKKGFSNSGGVFKSLDGGNTWNNIFPNITADFVVYANSTNPIIAYAAVHGSLPGVSATAGVYKSLNGGAFTLVNGTGNNIIDTSVGIGRIAIAVAQGDPSGNTVYAGVEKDSDSSLAGFYKTVDGGTNWTKLGPGILPSSIPNYCGSSQNQQCFYDQVIAVNPVDPNVVFVGGSGFPNANFLLYSTNAGGTWSLATSFIHADQHAFAFTPNGNKLFVGNDGGVYSTTNTSPATSSVTWLDLNANLNITQFYGYFSIHPTNSQITYGGTQDNGTQRFAGNLAWDEVACGDGAGAVVDVNNPNTVFTNCQDVDIRKSTSGSPGSFGVQNNSGATILNSGDRVSFIPPLVGDTSSPNMKLYFGTFRLWQGTTTTAPPTWTAIPGDLTGGGSETITNIAITPNNNTAFVVTTATQSSTLARVSRVDNLLSVSPTATTFTTPVPAGIQINAVAAVDSNTAYIAVPGFTAGSHVFKTLNGGSSWSNITSNLPNTPANDIVVDPDIAGTLYLATDVGVFKSINDGASWSTLSTGLPKVAVYGLKLHRPSRILRAATHGRGMWDLAVPACSVGPCLTLSSALNFGNQNVGTSSTPQTITLTSSGSQTLTISGISSSNPTEFSITGSTCGGSLAASATCTVSVTFTPSNAFNRSGTVSVSSNAPSSPTTASLSGVGIVVPQNDNFANGKIIPTLPYGDSVITNGATSQTTDPIPPRSSTSCVDVDYDATPGFNHRSVWYFYTPTVTDLVTIDTSGSDYDTVVSVWTGTPGNFSGSPIACNDDIDPGVVRQSRLTFGVTAGITYRILITGYYSTDSGTLVFNMSSLNLGFSRLARNGAAGTGTSTSPGTRPTRSVRSAADIVVVAGQSRSLDLELTSSGNSNEVINLECVGAPPGATCTIEPAQVTLNGASIPIHVRFNTSKAGAATGSGAGRSRRLSVNAGTAAGNYELKVNARVGDVARSTLITATVESNPAASRIKRELRNNR